MAEYIEREATCKNCLYYEVCPLGLAANGAIGTCLKFKNKADVVEVRHGEWVDHSTDDNDMVILRCSVCGRKQYGNSHYCPNCGAKMDGKGEG